MKKLKDLTKDWKTMKHKFFIEFSSSGGTARAKALSPKRRLEIAKLGGEATRRLHLRKKRKTSK